MKSLPILKHVSITEGNDWSGFMSKLPLPIEQTLLLLIDYGTERGGVESPVVDQNSEPLEYGNVLKRLELDE